MGIAASHLTMMTILGNKLEGGYDGIYLFDCYDCLVENNSCSHNYDGILSSDCINITFMGNNCTGNNNYGIDLENTDGSVFENNNCSENANFGMGLKDSDENEFSQNWFCSNVGHGIYIESGTGNRISNNAFVNNNGAGGTYESSHVQAHDGGEGNNWITSRTLTDYGNYWSDWTEPDADHDGIVDLPYVLSGNVDEFPLTSPHVVLPGVPENLSWTPDDSTIALEWDPPTFDGNAGITHYIIYRGNDTDHMEMLAAVENVTSFRDTNLTNGMTYHYSVSAVNLVGEGPATGIIEAIPMTVPGRPLNVTSWLVGSLQDPWVLLNWTTPGDDGGSEILGYNVYRRWYDPELNQTFEVRMGTSNVTNYTDTTVIHGIFYEYWTASFNQMGESAHSNWTNCTPDAIAPDAPGNLTGTTGNGRVNLSWTAPAFDGGTAITGYVIQRTADGGSTQVIDAGLATSYEDTGLSNGVTYTFRVAAINFEGQGTLSTGIEATPMTTPSPPTDLVSTTVGTGLTASNVLSWGPPSFDGGSPVVGYKIYRGMSAGSEEPLTEIGDTRTYTDEDIIDGLNYYYKVSAINGIGEGAPSDAVLAKRTVSIYGRIIDDGGNGVVNATVTIGDRMTMTETRGYFTMDVLPGDYTMTVQAEGVTETIEDVNVPVTAGDIGEFTVGSGGGGDDTLLYVTIGSIVAAIVIIMALVIVRRR
jgi:parallel beta-helix repeat protein